MLSRRSFLIGSGIIALAQLVSGCSDPETTLKVLLLSGSIPPQLLSEFRRQVTEGREISFKPEAQLQDLLNLLESWHKEETTSETQRSWFPYKVGGTPATANLLTLGDYWLAQAIKEKLIQPINITELDGWTKLPSPWQQLVRRNEEGELDENGNVWGAPYRWGSTMIAYRRDKFEELGWTPTDWSDLWREELRDRISIVNQPREVIGLTLKKLGHSYNTKDLTTVPNLKSELLALHKQIKYYSSEHYLEPLIIEDTWLAVGWSTDILPVKASKGAIAAVVPKSGTSLWADLWVKPRTIEDNSSLINQWINFCWQPKAASQISLFTDASSPIILSMAKEDIPRDLRNNPLIVPSPETLEKSDFLYPLPSESEKQYLSLWEEIRSVKVDK